MQEKTDDMLDKFALEAANRKMRGERFLGDGYRVNIYSRDIGDKWSHKWEEYLDGGLKSFEDVFTLEKINIIGVILDNYGKAKYLQYEYMTPYLPAEVQRLSLNKWSRDIMMVPDAESEELGVQIAKYWILFNVFSVRRQLVDLTDPSVKHRTPRYWDLSPWEKLEVIRYTYHLGNPPGGQCVNQPTETILHEMTEAKKAAAKMAEDFSLWKSIQEGKKDGRSSK